MAKKAETALFEIKPIEMVDIPLRIVGDIPLIVHAWSEKAREKKAECEAGELTREEFECWLKKS